MSWRLTRSHGFPAKIRTPKQKSFVHIMLENGMPCDKYVEVRIPTKTIGMRDWRKRPTRCENPA